MAGSLDWGREAMKRRIVASCRRWGLIPLVLLLVSGVAPAAWAQDEVLAPETIRIDTWQIVVMEGGRYFFQRDPGTGSGSGLDLLFGSRGDDELLRFRVFDGSDGLTAVELLAEEGLLADKEVEVLKALVEEAGKALSVAATGGWSDLTQGQLKDLEADPGTTTVGSVYIAQAVESLSTGDEKAVVEAEADDCTVVSGLYAFAAAAQGGVVSESSAQSLARGLRNAAVGVSATPGSAVPASTSSSGSAQLKLACQAVSWRPGGVPPYPAATPPAFPVPPPPFPIPVGPTTPAVWTNDPCTEAEEGTHRTCVDGSWNICTCLCTFSGGGGATWRKTGACTAQTPAAPGTPCSPAGGYGPCTAPGGVCICGGGPPAVWGAPPPPPPTGSAEIAALFAMLTLIAGLRLYRDRRRGV